MLSRTVRLYSFSSLDAWRTLSASTHTHHLRPPQGGPGLPGMGEVRRWMPFYTCYLSIGRATHKGQAPSSEGTTAIHAAARQRVEPCHDPTCVRVCAPDVRCACDVVSARAHTSVSLDLASVALSTANERPGTVLHLVRPKSRLSSTYSYPSVRPPCWWRPCLWRWLNGEWVQCACVRARMRG